MALEKGPVYVDTKNIAAAGTVEDLTDREIHCSSVVLLPQSGNNGDVYVVDHSTDGNTFPIPSAGITLPINDPRLIRVDAENNDNKIDWMAV